MSGPPDPPLDPPMGLRVMLYVIARLLFYFQISFVVGHVIDNGETVISRAGRTHPQYRGKGLLIRLGTYIIENWVLSKGITSVLFTITDANPHFSNESFQRLNKFSLAKVSLHRLGQHMRFWYLSHVHKHIQLTPLMTNPAHARV